MAKLAVDGLCMFVANRLGAHDRLAVGVLFVGTCVVFTVLGGRDTNWDQLNYHLYVAHAFVSDRLGRDFMAASIQSYLNPIAYLPFYWMVSLGVQSVWIGVALSLVHALNLILLYEVSRLVLGSANGRGNVQAILAAVYGATTPIFWSEVGTSFIDITTSVPVLLGILLLLRGRKKDDLRVRWHLVAGGIALGIATGLKLTNAIYLVAAAVLLVEIPRLSESSRNLFWYGAGGVGGFLAAHGYWALLLFREFGNPVFPLFNAIFRSPDFPPVNLWVDRFIPSTATDALSLPFRMAEFKGWVYVETVAPDLRVAVALGLLIALSTYRIWQRCAGRDRILRKKGGEVALHDDAAVRLTAFVLVSGALWMMTSANGRYGLPWLLMLGPITVYLLAGLFPPARTAVAMVTLVVLQTLHAAAAGNPHWSSDSWGGSWFDVTVPERLRQTPLLHLTPSTQPYAFVTMWLHDRSTQVNIAGQYLVPSEGPRAHRLLRLLDIYRRRTRALLPLVEGAEPNTLKRLPGSFDPFFSRLALKIDASDCEVITTNVRVRAPIRFLTSSDGSDRGSEGSALRLASCKLEEAGPEPPELGLERQRVARVFDMIESRCSRLLHAPGYGVERRGMAWMRGYLGSERYLVAVNGRISLRYPRDTPDRSLGTLEEWEAGLVSPHCDSNR